MTPKPNSMRQLPTKWLVAIVGVLIFYGLTQPMLNSRLGWSLPAVATLLGQEGAADAKSEKTSETATKASGDDNSSSSKSTSSAKPSSASAGDAAQASRTSAKKVEQASAVEETNELAAQSTDDLLYGLLKETRSGSENYLSPMGLRYTRGSAEGHRLKHLERHLQDQPTRPGKHGVFYGDMPQVLRWLDDAYDRGKRGAKGTSKRNEDRRTVYEVAFDKPLGYIGGRDGKRDGNPDAKRIRMVVEGDALITAFPF